MKKKKDQDNERCFIIESVSKRKINFQRLFIIVNYFKSIDYVGEITRNETGQNLVITIIPTLSLFQICLLDTESLRMARFQIRCRTHKLCKFYCDQAIPHLFPVTIFAQEPSGREQWRGRMVEPLQAT